MLKKLLWGLGVLVLLLCTALVFMTVRNLAEIRQLKEEADAIEKSLEVLDEPTQPIADNKPPPPGASNGHWHDGVWHEGTHEVSEIDKALERALTLPTDSPELKRSKIEAYKRYYRKETGHDLPPIGHYHVKGPDGVVRLAKKGEPFVPIKKDRKQFCPNLEQLKEFDRLKQLRIKAWQENDREEYDRIESEIYTLKNSPEAQGELPTTGSFAFVGMSPQEAISFANKKLKEAYVERGYEHLWGRYDLGPEPLAPLPFPDSN